MRPSSVAGHFVFNEALTERTPALLCSTVWPCPVISRAGESVQLCQQSAEQSPLGPHPGSTGRHRAGLVSFKGKEVALLLGECLFSLSRETSACAAKALLGAQVPHRPSEGKPHLDNSLYRVIFPVHAGVLRKQRTSNFCIFFFPPRPWLKL